eukprot:1133212-Ditylum_brightwellii.AAC.1
MSWQKRIIPEDITPVQTRQAQLIYAENSCRSFLPYSLQHLLADRKKRREVIALSGGGTWHAGAEQ